MGESKRIKKFLQSPFFNESDDIVKLFDYLSGFGPDYEKVDKKFSHGKAYRAVYGKAASPDETQKRIAQHLHKLSEKLEEYIVHSRTSGNDLKARLLLLAHYENVMSDNLFEETLCTVDKLLENQRYEDEFFGNTLLREETLSRYLTKKEGKHKKETQKENFQNSKTYNEALDNEYMVNKLQALCIMIDTKQIYKINVPIDEVDTSAFLSHVRTYLQKGQYSNTDIKEIIEIWYIALLMLKENNRDKWNKLYELLGNDKKINELFGKPHLQNLYSFLANVAIRISPPDRDRLLFDIYRRQLDNGILILLPTTYIGILRLALRLEKEYGGIWATGFMQKYLTSLSSEFQTPCRLYGEALICFKDGEFLEAQKILSNIMGNPSNMFLNLEIRKLRIMLYYEQPEMRQLTASDAESLRKYLDDSGGGRDISDHNKEAYLNFSKYVKHIDHINNTPGYTPETKKRDIDRLIVGLEQLKPQEIHELEWLKEKIKSIPIEK